MIETVISQLHYTNRYFKNKMKKWFCHQLLRFAYMFLEGSIACSLLFPSFFFFFLSSASGIKNKWKTVQSGLPGEGNPTRFARTRCQQSLGFHKKKKGGAIYLP